MGLQEVNMIGCSCWNCKYRKDPIVCSLLVFNGTFDQIQMSIACNQSPVILVGTHSGIAVVRMVTPNELRGYRFNAESSWYDDFQPSQTSEVQKKF